MSKKRKMGIELSEVEKSLIDRLTYVNVMLKAKDSEIKELEKELREVSNE